MKSENLVLIPVSVGELIDKISILKIKKLKIKDPIKLGKVENELSSLELLAEDFLLKKENQEKLIQLIDINSQLWEIEDQIRNLENKKCFDENFIDTARKVYYLNDDRFEIKKNINESNDSEIVEVKDYKEYRK